MFLLCSGDEDSSAQQAAPPAASAQPVNVDTAPIQQQQQQQQMQQQPQENEYQVAERASDPRRQPAPPAQNTEDFDADRDFARNGGSGGGGGQWQESHPRDETPYKDSRPNPNKHEDG